MRVHYDEIRVNILQTSQKPNFQNIILPAVTPEARRGDLHNYHTPHNFETENKFVHNMPYTNTST